MESIKKIMDRVNDPKLDLETKYPELRMNIGKNILFVSPMLNKQGIYRMILPALELKETGRFNTIISQIIPEDSKKTIDDFHIKLVPELIRWADFAVFSANGQNLEPVLKKIKEINPKIKIIMDMDRIYHALNPNNYTAKRFTIERQRNLESNLKLVDLSTYPDKVVEDFYKKKINMNMRTAILPNLLSPYQIEGIDMKAKRSIDKDGKFRVLIMSDADDFDDINSFRDTINDIMVRVPEAKIYVLGNSIMHENKNPLRFVNYTRVPYEDMTSYYKILFNINPDMAIVPIKRMAYYRTYYKILELGLFGIPTITLNEYPYNHLLKKDLHVLMSGQKKTLVSNVRAVVDNLEMREKLSRYLRQFVTDKYSFLNNDMMASYLKVFV
jgi:hypothetical protein